MVGAVFFVFVRMLYGLGFCRKRGAAWLRCRCFLARRPCRVLGVAEGDKLGETCSTSNSLLLFVAEKGGKELGCFHQEHSDVAASLATRKRHFFRCNRCKSSRDSSISWCPLDWCLIRDVCE